MVGHTEMLALRLVLWTDPTELDEFDPVTRFAGQSDPHAGSCARRIREALARMQRLMWHRRPGACAAKVVLPLCVFSFRLCWRVAWVVTIDVAMIHLAPCASHSSLAVACGLQVRDCSSRS